MKVVLLVTGIFLMGVSAMSADVWPQYPSNPFVIQLDIPAEDKSLGGIITADVDDDGLMDYLVTKPGVITCAHHEGKTLWTRKLDVGVRGQSESQGLPGWHGPGVQAADVDGDGETEVLFMTKDGTLHVVEGKTGKNKHAPVDVTPLKGMDVWEVAIVANFRGKGDRDILFQATNPKRYRMGKYLAACAYGKGGKLTKLWSTGRYLGCAHNSARVADINGDGKDEVLGATLLGADGKLLYRLPRFRGHLDSIFVYDVLPDRPGLEVVALQEGGKQRVFLYDDRGLIWHSHHRNQEPQNAAVGRFDPKRKDLQVWCRTRYNEHQRPFVLDAAGKLVKEYRMDDVAPKGWTVRGVEVISCIDWTGGAAQLACAKERHRSGDVAIFQPIGGKFVKTFRTKADRLYVADVSGDPREEILVVNGTRLEIYHNDQPNPQPNKPRLWSQQHYRRSKMTWNYYSP